MTYEHQPSATADFLIRLRKIDKRTLTIRDVPVLYVIIKSPGISGVEIANKLGFKDRSAISTNVTRLVREGYIEDRREVRRKANPASFHALPLGLEFWDDIKP